MMMSASAAASGTDLTSRPCSLAVLNGLGGRTQANDDVHTGIAQVQRMSVTLGTVTDDGEPSCLRGPRDRRRSHTRFVQSLYLALLLCSGVNAWKAFGFLPFADEFVFSCMDFVLQLGSILLEPPSCSVSGPQSEP